MNALPSFMDDGLELFINSYYGIHIFFTDFICKQYEKNVQNVLKTVYKLQQTKRSKLS